MLHLSPSNNHPQAKALFSDEIKQVIMASAQSFAAEAAGNETISAEGGPQPVQQELARNCLSQGPPLHYILDPHSASEDSSRNSQQLPSSSTPSSLSSLSEIPDHPPAAAEAVFNTSALLERILLSIDTSSLLHAQRVSKTFLHTILGSRLLKRQLWLVPPRLPDRRMWPIINPFLRRFETSFGIKNWIQRGRGDAIDIVMRLASPKELKKVRRGSWKDMLVFRPNCEALGRLILHVEMEDTPCVYDVLAVRIGWDQVMKMGDLMDLAIRGASA